MEYIRIFVLFTSPAYLHSKEFILDSGQCLWVLEVSQTCVLPCTVHKRGQCEHFSLEEKTASSIWDLPCHKFTLSWEVQISSPNIWICIEDLAFHAWVLGACTAENPWKIDLINTRICLKALIERQIKSLFNFIKLSKLNVSCPQILKIQVIYFKWSHL